MKNNEHHMHAAKNFLAFMIVAIAASMFFVFYNNQDNIMKGDSFHLFMTLVIIGAGLLVGLLYLISNMTHNPSVKSSRSASKSTIKTKKKKK